MKRCFGLLFSIAAAGACGGSDLDPGAGSDPGEGTSTLLVDGNVTARPRLVNARARGEFDTEIRVRVSLNQLPVTAGTVEVTSAGGTVALAFDPTSEGGRWVGTAAGYDEVYILDVRSGEDFVEGVRVDGPDIHVFTAPTAGLTVDSTQPLRVTWDADQTADSASIDTEELDRVSITDTGEYMLAAGALKAEKDKAHENTLELVRTNRVTPAGAVGGSELSVGIENRIQVVAQPNPAL
ncbi:MAG TPA: hypothetical protein VNO30_26680 [Kofleriaceae bacterium]|nr:hypothetical protein [Kofleriaceae bacterium]